MLYRIAFAAVALSAAAACNGEDSAAVQPIADAPVAPAPTPSPSPSPSGTPVAGTPFARAVIADFDAPWAMTFLPDRRMLVTEKKGDMLLVAADGASRRTIATIDVDSAGQGGLMDVVLAPDFATSKRIYFSYSAGGQGGKGVVLARGVLVHEMSLPKRAGEQQSNRPSEVHTEEGRMPQKEQPEVHR